jgi:hypothetical protein
MPEAERAAFTSSLKPPPFISHDYMRNIRQPNDVLKTVYSVLRVPYSPADLALIALLISLDVSDA